MFSDVDVDRLTTQLREGGQAGQEAAQEISRALLNINSDVDRARAGVGVFGDSWNEVEREARQALQRTQTELQDTGTEVDRVRSGLAALATGAVGAKLSGDIDDVTSSAGHLRAMLGLTKEEAKEFEKVSRDVYSEGLGEDLREVTSAVAQVNQALGLTGDELKSQTENVLLLNKTFEELGADTQTDLNAVKVMTEAWGISSQEAFDIITTGFQNGAGRSGDLLDTLTEYPTHFKALGLTAKDSLSWLSIGMENGAFNTDKLADSIKEFGIRVKTDGDTAQVAIQNMFPPEESQRLLDAFAAGGDAGRDAFYKVFEALSQIEDPAQRYNTAIQLMGTQAEDLTADTLLPMMDAFVKQKDAQMETEGATKTLGEELSGLNATLEQLSRTIEMSTIGSLGVFAPVLQLIIQGVSGVGMALLALQGLGISTGGILTTLGTAASTAGGFLRTVLGGALTFLTGPAGLAILAIAGIGLAIYEIIKHGESITQFFSDALGGIKLMFTDLKDFIFGIWDVIVGGAKSYINMYIDALNFLIRGMNTISFTIPEGAPIYGGQTWGINISEIPKFHDGGIFRAATLGGEGLALLRDGERILTPGSEGGGLASEISSLRDCVISLANAITNSGKTPLASGSGGMTVLVLDNQDLMKLERKLQPIRQLEKGRRG